MCGTEPAAETQAPSHYLPEIDGLRAIAVLAVLVFHLAPGALPGGFVGVDVFFVISGYLIGAKLLRQIDAGQFSLETFYQRRIARIAPMALLVIIATIGASALTYSSQDFAYVGASGVAAALGTMNFRLLYHPTYFAIQSDTQPLMHYWSLAVEEQFYVIFPILLYFSVRWVSRPLAILCGLCVASFIASIIVTPIAPSAAYFLLPTRAWELLAGSCLALWQTRRDPPASGMSVLALAAGAAVLLVSFSNLSGEGFPGWIALMPVAATLAMIAGLAGRADGGVRRTLASPGATFIGRRSFSLYLWHWPVFALVDHALFLSSEPVRIGAKLMITAALTLLFHACVEVPLRERLKRRPARALAFVLFAIATAGTALLAHRVRASHYIRVSPPMIARGGAITNGGDAGTVVMIGDSQGAMYRAAMARMAREQRFRLFDISISGRNALPGQRDTLWPQVSGLIGRTKPDVVIIAQAWSGKLGDGLTLSDGLRRLTPLTRCIVVLAQPPIFPKNFGREHVRRTGRTTFREPQTLSLRRLRALGRLSDFHRGNWVVLDPAPLFATQSGEARVVGRDGAFLYKDGSHLSETGTMLVVDRLQRSRCFVNMRRPVR